MLRRNIKQRIAGALIAAMVLLALSPAALAGPPHEDPEAARLVFSGVSLLRYYSASLDLILRREPAAVEARLTKMPFANMPQRLYGTTERFATSSIGLSRLVVQVDKNVGKLTLLAKQFRLEETVATANQTFAELLEADRELEQIEQATKTTGVQLKVFSAPAGSSVRQSYQEVLDRVNWIREMLGRYWELLADLLRIGEAGESGKSPGITLEELLRSDTGWEQLLRSVSVTWAARLKPTATTLKIEPAALMIEPAAAFVGDYVHFEGTLSSGANPLAGRKVDILLDSSRCATVETDTYGRYAGTLLVPYRYVPELAVQGLYYPQGEDVGAYLASLSPAAKLKVLFYQTGLDLTVKEKAYPGRPVLVAGRFHYGQSPPLGERRAEIYLDDVLVAEVMAQETFAQEIEIDARAELGRHIITVSAPAAGRYSPVEASVVIDVTKVTPFLELDVPRLAMVPGSITFGGRIYSEVGPVKQPLIEMRLGRSPVELVSAEDSVFTARIKVGMGSGVVGWQTLAIRVLPQEPWHTPVSTSSTIMMVNTVNCAGILAFLILVGIYLPRQLRVRFGTYGKRAMTPALVPAITEATPYPGRLVTYVVAEEGSETSREPRNRIFSLYRVVVRLIQGIARVLPKPQQTLREFAYESGRVLGLASTQFFVLTTVIERLLYSQYRPTEEDASSTERLSRTIEQASAAGATQPTEDDGLLSGAALELDTGVTASWQPLPSWLWLLLVAVVVGYIYLLLFLVPVLLLSFSGGLPVVIIDDLPQATTVRK